MHVLDAANLFRLAVEQALRDPCCTPSQTNRAD